MRSGAEIAGGEAPIGAVGRRAGLKCGSSSINGQRDRWHAATLQPNVPFFGARRSCGSLRNKADIDHIHSDLPSTLFPYLGMGGFRPLAGSQQTAAWPSTSETAKSPACRHAPPRRCSAAVGHDIPLETGATRGEASGGYQWALDIMPYSQNGRPNAGVVRGYWVEITVTRKTGRRRQDARISLRSLKLKPAR